nr:MAG: internal scaffolding protein [Microviridae sp.]
MTETFKKGTPSINVGKSVTQQHFEPLQNINNIMAQFRQTGDLGDNQPTFGNYADVSNIPDYQTALNVVRSSEAKFAQLPSYLRERFHNSPEQLLAFVQDKNNKAEAIELGIINPDPIKPIVTEPKKEAQPTVGPVPT